jgi:SAM-dependent methyltransferase
MREDSNTLEETRLKDVDQMDDYQSFHERHRIFPEVFEGRNHRRVIDIAAGVGCAAKRIQKGSSASVIVNDIAPKCLQILHDNGFPVLTFDLDDPESKFPFQDGSFDAVVSLATIEHLIHLDHHLKEIHRILEEDGYLYISSPNYAGLVHLPRYLLAGRSFHNPLKERTRYEFYAHVRYFTFKTLLEFVSSFGFMIDTVYLPVPEESSYYESLRSQSRLKAFAFQNSMKFMYRFFSPRWASEPVLCFRKTNQPFISDHLKFKKKLM